MAIIASLSSRLFLAQANDIPFAVAADATLIKVTLTHANTIAGWPDGTLLRWDVLWSGVATGESSISGGIRNGKDGLPLVGNVSTTFERAKPPGITSGVGRFTVLQPLTCSVLVESF